MREMVMQSCFNNYNTRNYDGYVNIKPYIFIFPYKVSDVVIDVVAVNVISNSGLPNKRWGE